MIEELGTRTKNKWKMKYQSYLDGIYDKFDWGAYSSRANNREKIREIKDLISKEAEKIYMPIKVNVSNMYNYIEAYKLNRYVLNIPVDYINMIRNPGVVDKLIKAISLLPNNSHRIHASWISSYMHNDIYLLKGAMDMNVAYKEVVKYFEGKITYKEVIKYFINPDAKEYLIGGLGSAETFSGGKEVGTYIKIDLNLYKKALGMIGKKFIKQTVALYTPSIRKGSRISPAYIKKASYKPLLEKSVTAPSKAKVMIIHDCSGSMSSGKYSEHPAYKAASFIGALVNSGVVDVSHVVYHSSLGWMDMANRIKEGDICHYYGSDEGFQYIDDNLPSEWVKEVDYVVVTTDLRYSSAEQRGLVEYLKRAPAHIVLSFAHNTEIKELKSKVVNDMKDMVNAVMKMNGKA